MQSGGGSFSQRSCLKGEEDLSVASFITGELINQAAVALFCFIYAEVA
jgi:hypothetical protein